MGINSKSNKKPPKPLLPKWITIHFRESLDSHEMLIRIIHISKRGIGALRGMPRLVKVLADIEEKSNDPLSIKQLKQAEKEALLAQTEGERDFPILHGLAVVALWSWLEHFIKNFISLWLLNRREAFLVPSIQRLKVKLGDYLKLTKVEQVEFVVELLEQDLASSLKRGINRFESLLEPFNLSGQVSENCSKNIFELQQVRNVIAHRNGKVDQKIMVSCPWLKLKKNQKLNVSSTMLLNYSRALEEYLLTFLYRVGDLYGVDLREDQELPVNAENEN